MAVQASGGQQKRLPHSQRKEQDLRRVFTETHL